ncbi:MAG: hypothetical protein IJ849_04605 [Selenomonadaceae bacterium]|nr:hypothetical protein [Selenomonadaceae bacterium]
MNILKKWSLLGLALLMGVALPRFGAAAPLNLIPLSPPPDMEWRYAVDIDGDEYFLFFDDKRQLYLVFDAHNHFVDAVSAEEVRSMLAEYAAETPTEPLEEPTRGSDQPTLTATQNEASYAEEVLRIVNEERAKAGAAPLTLAADLNESAQIRAGELPTLFSHTRPDSSDCFTVLKNRGRTCGENIAAGQSDAELVMDSWMNSEGHRTNILDPKFKELGVGYVLHEGTGYRHFWVQLFRG